MKEFYEALEKLQPRRSNVEAARNELNQVINGFAKNIKAINVPIANPDFAYFLNLYKENLSGNIDKWLEFFADLEKQEKIRSDLENSFIVVIYGKVKAGKSTLGNYVAEHRLPSQSVQFEVYDKQNQSRISSSVEGFKTDILECTAEIQLFKIGALAWVDTPGLSSMTKENGDLARNYIDNADFVIFPTSSDSPLQNDEIQQIAELIAVLKKKLSIVITKSDITEEDEVDDEIVQIVLNKDEATRTAQNNDVKARLIEQLQKRQVDYNQSILGDVISLSVNTASRGHKGDNDLYDKSNIEQFYQMLTDSVLAKAQMLKQSAPYDSLSSLITKIVGSNSIDREETLANLKLKLADLKRTASNLEFDAQQSVINLKSNITSLIVNELSTVENTITKENSVSVLESCVNKIHQQVLKLMQEELASAFQNFDTSSFGQMSINADDLKITDRTATITHYVVERRTSRGGLLSGFLGAAIGLVTPGPLGAAALGTAGYALGRKSSGGGTRTYTTEEVVGDNKQEMLSQFTNNLMNYYSDDFQKEIVSFVKTNLTTPIHTVIEQYEQEINQLESTLSKLQAQYAKKQQ